MAQKPRSQWSDAYRRRIERAEAKGKSRQAARGHKVKEHVLRKEHELREQAETGKPTSAQRSIIRRWARKQASKDATADPSEMADAVVSWANEAGWEKFEKLRDTQKSLAKEYRQSGQPYGQSHGMEFMDSLAEDIDEEVPSSWLYYH